MKFLILFLAFSLLSSFHSQQKRLVKTNNPNTLLYKDHPTQSLNNHYYLVISDYQIEINNRYYLVHIHNETLRSSKL